MSPPSPPCYAVIFVSKQSAQKDGYEETAEHMLELAKRQPGFLGGPLRKRRERYWNHHFLLDR